MAVASRKHTGWIKRKARVKKQISKNTDRARLNIYRSNKHIYAQVVDNVEGKTLVSASTLTKGLREESGKLKKVDAARKVGELVGRLAMEKGVEKVVFDRSGYIYHGRVKALAEGAREAGLKF